MRIVPTEIHSEAMRFNRIVFLCAILYFVHIGSIIIPCLPVAFLAILLLVVIAIMLTLLFYLVMRIVGKIYGICFLRKIV